jgi:anti-sigma factor RsiW
MSDKCRDVKSLIGAFADGELDRARAELVRSHVAACADCRRELERVEALHNLVKKVEQPKLADDYWDWQRTRVWHGIRHDRRELARPRRQPFLFGRYAGMVAGAAVVLVIVFAGWRMFGQGSLVGTGRSLMAEKSEGAEPEVIAVTPEAAAGEEKAAGRGRESDRVLEVPRAEEATGTTGAGSAGVTRGGSAGAADEVRREPVAATLREQGEGMAAAGLKDRSDIQEPVQRQVRASEHPVRTGTVGKVAQESPAPPVAAKKESTVRFAQAGVVNLSPELLSAPGLPDVAEKDTGTAVLRLTTDSLGVVTRAVVMRSRGRALNDSIAVRNARASRFKPVLREGRRLGSVFQRQYRFKMVARKSEQNEDKPKREPPEQDEPTQDKPQSDKPQQDKPQPGKPIRSGE